ncbi:LamG domain-containing protein [Candidatus Poribacteria bacterium]
MSGKYQCLFLIFTLAFAVGVSAQGAQDAVLYMSFNQEPEDMVEDESGYENHGDIVGLGVEWIADGKFGGAMEFDGTSKIEIPHSDSLNLGKEMTLEIWFRTEVPQTGRFMIYKLHNGGGRNYQWGIYLTAESTTVSTYVVKPNDEVAFISKGGDYKDGEWHFLAGTYDGETLTCYIDGEIVSKAWVADIRTGDGPVVIGTWGANFFTGALDEAVIYNVALTEEQLRSDYENGFIAVSPKGRLSTKWADIKAQ